MFRKMVAAALAFLVLSACGEDPLRQRKLHCDNYVISGHLTESEGKACYADKSIFEKAASSAVKKEMSIYYPRVLRGAEKLNAHARTYDKSRHRSLPLGTEIPIIPDVEGGGHDWRYVVELQNVTITPPEGKYSTDWTIAGRREGEDWLHLYHIMGVGVYALQELELSCDVFTSRQGVAKGCRAKVYLDLLIDRFQIPKIAAMAIELISPSKEEARRAAMEFQMLFW